MKRVLCICTVLIIIYSCAYANDIDLSNMTFTELYELRKQCQLEMMKKSDWQEVTVPQGIWKVGEDIPAGTWTVRCSPEGGAHNWTCDIEWGDSFDEETQMLSMWGDRYESIILENPESAYYKKGDPVSCDITVFDGDYIIINTHYCPAVFSTYIGKPDLGFK